MKHILFAVPLLLLICSCKKDKPAKEKALGKIFENNILIDEYVYSPQRKMMQVNSYDEVTGVLTQYALFKYDLLGHMIARTYFEKTGKKIGQSTYSWNEGKLVQYDYVSLSGADSGQITTRKKLSYDNEGRLGKESQVDIVTANVRNSIEYAYYSNGNVKENAYYSYNPTPALGFKTIYSPGDNMAAPNLLKFKPYPVDFFLNEHLGALQQHFYQYQFGALIYEINTVCSNRQFDDKGCILQQTRTRHHIFPAGPDEVTQWRYEYIDL